MSQKGVPPGVMANTHPYLTRDQRAEMGSTLEYFGMGLPSYASYPTTNEEAYTWIPLMDFRGLTPVDPYDITLFNALLLLNKPWRTAARATTVANLRLIFAVCIKVHAAFKSGPLERREVGPFYAIVFDYIVGASLPTGEGALRMANLVNFFVTAFWQYNSTVGQRLRHRVHVDNEIMMLHFTISEFFSMTTGAKKIFLPF